MTQHFTPQAKANYQAKESDTGYQKVIGYLPAAHGLTLAQNDTIEMVKMPVGAIVTDLRLITGSLGTSVTASVGDASTAARYLSAEDVSAGINKEWDTHLSGIPYVITSSEPYITVTLAAANPEDNIAIAVIVGYVNGVDITP